MDGFYFADIITQYIERRRTFSFRPLCKFASICECKRSLCWVEPFVPTLPKARKASRHYLFSRSPLNHISSLLSPEGGWGTKGGRAVALSDVKYPFRSLICARSRDSHSLNPWDNSSLYIVLRLSIEIHWKRNICTCSLCIPERMGIPLRHFLLVPLLSIGVSFFTLSNILFFFRRQLDAFLHFVEGNFRPSLYSLTLSVFSRLMEWEREIQGTHNSRESRKGLENN